MNYISEFKQYLREQDKSPHTIKAYISDITLFSVWFEDANGEPMEPAGIHCMDVIEYRESLEELAPATINRKLASISAFCQWAKKHQLAEDDPTTDVKGIATVARSPKSLRRNEMKALLRAVTKSGSVRDRAIVGLLLHTGLRAGEAATIKLNDIEINPRSGHVSVIGKGMKQRTVPLNADARRVLEEWLKERRENKHSFLFTGQRGDPLSGTAISAVVKKYAKLAGLKNVTAHNLRHTFARMMIDRSIPLPDVQALLGHADISTTAIYLLPDENKLQEAVEKLESS